MTEPNEADELASARQLGESYAALVGKGEWQVDVVPEAVPVGEPGASAAGASSSPVADAHGSPEPPLAEPVNEPTIPPTAVQIIEALLFVGGPPLRAEHAAEAIRGLTTEQFRECIDVLNRVYRSQSRPYSVVHGSSGYVLRVSRKFAAVRERLFGGPREARLNQPALDVLSLVAYRQPVGKAEIDGARGADSGGVLRQLVRLGLVSSDAAADGAALFRTTGKFLEVFRLRGLDDLPELGEPMRVP
jgi:segregation and condensation protein B